MVLLVLDDRRAHHLITRYVEDAVEHLQAHAHAWHAHGMRTVCAWHVHGMCMACAWHVHMHGECLLGRVGAECDDGAEDGGRHL
eukprot:scaffold97528_cov45-Phaeocystis_antarctica.AAC.1